MKDESLGDLQIQFRSTKIKRWVRLGELKNVSWKIKELSRKKVPRKGQRDDSQLKNWILVTDNWSDDRQNKKVSCESQQKKCDTTEELKETLTNRIDFNASKRRSNEVLFCCDYCKNERPAFGMKKYPKEKKIKEEQLEKLVQWTKCYLWITRIINEKTGRLGKKNFSEK